MIYCIFFRFLLVLQVDSYLLDHWVPFFDIFFCIKACCYIRYVISILLVYYFVSNCLSLLFCLIWYNCDHVIYVFFCISRLRWFDRLLDFVKVKNKLDWVNAVALWSSYAWFEGFSYFVFVFYLNLYIH